jgi:hypothetical protein
LKEGTNYREFMVDVPDEYDSWVTEVEEELIGSYNFIEATIKAEYKLLAKNIKSPAPTASDREDRNSPALKMYNKEFFELVKDHKLSGYLLDVHNGKDYSGSIWNQIRPEYQKPLWGTERIDDVE